MKQYTTNLQKNTQKQSPTVSRSRGLPEQSAPHGRVGQAVPPSRLLLELGNPSQNPPPVHPRDPAFPPGGQGPTEPPQAREDVGEKAPDHSILVFVCRKGDSESLGPIAAQCSVWLGKKQNKNSGVEPSKPRHAVGIK